MRFIFYSPAIGPKWDYYSLSSGIGGSETFHIEMATRLARRGHRVISYNNLGVGGRFEQGVEWRDLGLFEFWSVCGAEDQRAVWVIQRNPEFLPQGAIPSSLSGQAFWHVHHDVTYGTDTPERMTSYDRLIALSPFHAQFLRNQGHENVTVSSGGIAVDRISDLPPVERNPHRIIYASAPDRGLLFLLKSFIRAKEHVPDLELHVYYGWEGFDQRMERDVTGEMARQKRLMLQMLQHPGVTWHGRVSQTELWTGFLQSGIWVYQTQFPEICCVTAMEAQALGCIPIFNPVWALRDNVFSGIAIEGECWEDRLVAMRFTYEIARLANLVNVQEAIRPRMMEHARQRFDWDRVVDQFEQMAAEDMGEGMADAAD